ncbi:hypothetical protein [Novilysobacter defluvii]|uniref:Lipoprotein n=1 Tax=Lysobacter defluvii IMMIB APB-9 = DSM 18482 TaxID=1385515 RepID=A0A0A0MBL5_9GAMM|nr:hypothetical protein [Lysobacter defluvii]KGO99807.1 hypothetical protein N791_13830 [Lysobacter defluvii IMMIB APB-9 = DSM 18482]
MRMKPAYVTGACLLLAGLFMTACSGEEVPVADDQPQVDAESGSFAESPPVPAVDELVSSLLSGGAAKLRYDRTGPTPDETGRERQVYLEMLDKDVEQAERLVSNVLLGHDYQEVRRTGDPDDVHLTFGKQGKPDLSVRIRSRETHSNLTEPDARSSTYVTYML